MRGTPAHRLVCGMATLHLLAAITQGQVLFDGEGGDQRWFTAINWSTNAIPNSADFVRIDEPFGVVDIRDGDAFARRLTALGGLRLRSASLTLVGPSEVVNLVLLPPGIRSILHIQDELSISGDSAVTDGTLAGANLGCSITNWGTFTAKRTRFEDLQFINHGLFQVVPTSNCDGQGGIIQNFGTVLIPDGAHLCSSITNTGLVHKTGAGDSNLRGGFTQNSGTLQVDEDELLVVSVVFNGGEVHVAEGASIRFGGVFNTVRFDGAGVIDLESSRKLIQSELRSHMTQSPGLKIRNELIINGLLINEAEGIITARDTEWIGDGAIENFGQITVVDPFVYLGVELRNAGTFLQQSNIQVGPASFINQSDGRYLLENGRVLLPPEGIDPGRIVNQGIIEHQAAGDGRVLRIWVPLDMEPESQFIIRGDHVELLDGGVWTGGQVIAENDDDPAQAPLALLGDDETVYTFDGDFAFNSTASIDFGSIPEPRQPIVDITGRLEFNVGSPTNDDVGAYLLSPLITGSGSIVNQEKLFWTNADIRLDGAIENHGTLVITPNDRALLDGNLINNQTVMQHGSIHFADGVITNRGQWNVHETSFIGYDWPLGGRIVNEAVFNIGPEAGSPRFSVALPFDNRGTVHVGRGSAEFQISIAQLDPDTGVLSGGDWIVLPNGSITLPRPVRAIVGPTRFDDDSGEWSPSLRQLELIDASAWVASPRVESRGDLLINDHSYLKVRQNLTAAGAVQIADASTVIIEPGATLRADIGVTNGRAPTFDSQLISARDQTCAQPVPKVQTPVLSNLATLLPGGSQNAGAFDITNDFIQESPGVLSIELGGVNPICDHDALFINGNANLSGTLDVTLISDFIPTRGQEFTIITAGSFTGQFDTINLPDLGPDLILRVDYEPTRVVVRSSCLADFNNDGIVNILDFLAFLNAYNDQDPRADMNGDGVINTQDFIAYLNEYNRGCG